VFISSSERQVLRDFGLFISQGVLRLPGRRESTPAEVREIVGVCRPLSTHLCLPGSSRRL